MARQRVNRPIAHNHRVAVAGMTGSGKSKLVGAYMMMYKHVIAIDVKGDSDEGLAAFWPAAYMAGEQVPIYHKLADLFKHKEGKAIWRPDPHEMTPEHFEACFQWVYERRNTVLWIDEVYGVLPEGSADIPFWYKAILTRGRSRGIGCWSCTQRPKFVPNFIFSEAEHTFCFRLKLATDRQKVAEWMGKEVMANPPGDHGFWYSSVFNPDPVLMPHGIQVPIIE